MRKSRMILGFSVLAIAASAPTSVAATAAMSLTCNGDGTACAYVDQCPLEPAGQNPWADALCQYCFGPNSFAYPGCQTGGDCEPEATVLLCSW